MPVLIMFLIVPSAYPVRLPTSRMERYSGSEVWSTGAFRNWPWTAIGWPLVFIGSRESLLHACAFSLSSSPMKAGRTSSGASARAFWRQARGSANGRARRAPPSFSLTESPDQPGLPFPVIPPQGAGKDGANPLLGDVQKFLDLTQRDQHCLRSALLNRTKLSSSDKPVDPDARFFEQLRGLRWRHETLCTDVLFAGSKPECHPLRATGRIIPNEFPGSEFWWPIALEHHLGCLRRCVWQDPQTSVWESVQSNTYLNGTLRMRSS